MNIKIFMLCIMLSGSASFAHHLDAVSSVQYSIQRGVNSNGSAAYDLTHGIVHFTEPDGTIKRYVHAHMARIQPATAQQIFGTIVVDLANELAGTWYIYQ